MRKTLGDQLVSIDRLARPSTGFAGLVEGEITTRTYKESVIAEHRRALWREYNLQQRAQCRRYAPSRAARRLAVLAIGLVTAWLLFREGLRDGARTAWLATADYTSGGPPTVAALRALS